jgi:ribonucleoside-diphosphate reductase alpha chain
VPLHDLVHKFAHVRFEPSGFTANPEIPIAKSIIDYIFRWMGSRFLPPEDRATLGLVDRTSAGESSVQPLNLGLGGSGGISGGAGLSGSDPSGAAAQASPPSGSTAVAAPGSEAPSTPPASEGHDDTPHSQATPVSSNGNAPASAGGSGTNGNGKPRISLGSLGIGKAQVTFAAQADAPSCAECGSIMVRNGSCYKCLNCGSTSGCS